MLKTLVNAVLFQCGWFACVMGGNGPWLLVGLAALGVHLLWTTTASQEVRALLAVTLLGTLIDTLLRTFGVFHFSQPGPLIPFWLILLWALLATTLRHCLAWSARPWWRASLLGAIGGPLSYYAGSQLAGVSFAYGTTPTLIGLALLWALLFPLLHGVARQLAH
ncbi:DUF2878 domain-containing protein [Pseudomonas sp. MPB23]|uniref:DUF2878 domain-containing protein n=1 Tax=Pseudomonas sp. MPB23 TaxID=3388490 RepID=UPI00398539BF